MDKRTISSSKNGKKGGRPKGSVSGHTLEAQELRKRLIQAASEQWEAIIFSLIDNAIGGNTIAQRELLDRVLGKAIQPLASADEHGNLLPFQIIVKQKDSAVSPENRS
jgi:hypothetical protein